MAQHDYVINNQSGAAFRADLNNALAAIVSNNSGDNEPSYNNKSQGQAPTMSRNKKPQQEAATPSCNNEPQLQAASGKDELQCKFFTF